jgi:exodeoxyribonuclease VII small subunit
MMFAPRGVRLVPNSSPGEPTFEQALAKLDEIVRQLEDGDTGLEESLARYEEGVGLLKCCYTQLRQAEQRILELTGVDEQGQPLLKPFEHTATPEAAKRPRKPV